jgi:transcriptional regulator GlxA family with amidase domain
VASLEEVLLTSMLLELPALTAAGLLAPPEDRALGRGHARRAADWARGHLAEPVTMAGWARGVGLSVRHLQKVFRDTHGCSPGQYLVTIRLEHAHRLLQRADVDETVTSIATQAGFTHLGRFAAAYRERYGTPPSSTLHRRR